MRTVQFTIVTILMVSLISCGGTGRHLASAEEFSELEKDLNDKFGNDAYYTDLTIAYDKTAGSIVGVTVTDAPESLKMGQWNLMRNAWEQNSEITLEVPEGTKAADFMFQLGEDINLTQLGKLSEKSIQQLTAEKNIENPVLDMAFIKFPKNGNLSKTEYTVMLEPENGGSTFTFRYALSGELIKMDY